MKLLSIGLFGVIGVLARYFLGVTVGRIFPTVFPYGTLVINLIGAFLIGVVYVFGIEHVAIDPELRLGVMVGFLGGFTTFSSYCLEIVRLIEESEYFLASVYFSLSNAGGVLATLAGLVVARVIMREID